MFKDLTNLITKRNELSLLNDSFTKRLAIHKLDRRMNRLAKKVARESARKVYNATLSACQALIKK